MYILIHPFDGFYSMKFEKEGTMRLAIINFFMVCLSYSFMNQYTGILVAQRHPNSVNSMFDFFMLTTALILFGISNWAVTSLTDGEGKFYEIIMACCYALTPVVLTFIPVTVLSNFLSINETGFFTMIVTAAIVYSILLAYIGLVVVHNYTAIKAVKTVILTFIALLIILFLFTLLFSLLQQLAVFIESLYIEITFRM